ncbi:MAG: response regulator, partial [Myxococcota bacterium]
SICHQLVKLMGGHLDVDSQEGIGSRFYFDLPFVPAPDDNTTPQLDDVRLAVIGRQLPEKQRIERLLREEGARLVPASAAHLKIFVGTSTDAALDADIVVWPSSSLTDRTDSAIHFTQPIRRRTLVDACKGNIGRPPAKPHSNRPPEAHAEHPQVLVVDDNPVNRLVASKILQRLGVDVDVAEDGPTAVKACRSGIYELVFMDLQMPGMDGFEATERLKGEHGQRTPRVVALTASTLPEDHMRAKAAGMVDFLTKPIQLDDVRGLLERQSIMPRSSAVNQRTSE